MNARQSKVKRSTSETDIQVELNLDGEGNSKVTTGIPFLDHMLISLARHGRFDLVVTAAGDLAVDDHHTVEDCALVLGEAVDQALGNRLGIDRFGTAYAPLDEALTRVVIDLSGRGSCCFSGQFSRHTVGGLSTENVGHFFSSFAAKARATIHADILRGVNDHHRIESAFKALGLALRYAASLTDSGGIPSTKGVL